MKITNLLICFMIAAILVSISSTTVFAQETIEDCLKFACPTVYGANYPEDCKIYVEYNGQTYDLIFDNSTQYLKDMLDEHYSESFSKCIKIKVTGDLQAQACPADDPACVPTYEIKVIDLEIIGEMSYCTDSDDGINFMIKGTTTGIQDPTTNEVVTVSDFCFSSAGGKEWVQEYYCGTTGPAAGYIVGISHECPYGCEDGACLIALEKKIIDCVDSDGKNNFDKKGTVTIYYEDGSTEIFEDSCGYSSGGTSYGAKDYYCVIKTDGSITYNYGLKPCKNCKDGVCLAGEINVTEEPVEEIVNVTEVQIEETGEGIYGIYGIYATLGEKFKLQETQPVKIIDYLDKNNNPLRIYLQAISKEDQSIKCEVLFGDNSEIVKIYITETEEVFGADIKFVSIDDNWEYATLEVTAVPKAVSAEEVKILPSEKVVAVRATKALTTLESVKTTVPEQAIGIEIAQEKILDTTTETAEFEQKIKQRGIDYKLKWFFGMVAEQEKQDAEFLRNQGQKFYICTKNFLCFSNIYFHYFRIISEQYLTFNGLVFFTNSLKINSQRIVIFI